MTLRSDRLSDVLQTQAHNLYGASIDGGMEGKSQLMKFKV